MDTDPKIYADMSNSLLDELAELKDRLKIMEERFLEMGYDTKAIVQSEIKTRWKIPAQAETMFGLHTAICVDTDDPLSSNRVRFFSPLLHDPSTRVKQLPWAYPISSMGGFDDSGLSWTPPAGSKLVLGFEGGNRQMAFYFGTTWDRDRGADGQHKWNFPVQEYYQLHEGNRKGYMVGANDGSQVYPPWNSEAYNSFDFETTSDLELDPEAKEKRTFPSIYGFKTVGKGFLQFVDGDYKRDMRWSRVVLQSPSGNWMIMKDDPLSDCGDWANPECGGENQYHKNRSECRPYVGSGGPENMKCELEQAGLQFGSRGGHTLVFHDKVDDPDYVPNWESSMQAFDFGRNDRALCYAMWKSITGHKITLDDTEDQSGVRGVDNGINIESALGNYVKLSDNTDQCPCGENEGQAKGATGRGIDIGSTSGHRFVMDDGDNQHCACRKEEHDISRTSKTAFTSWESGYGLKIRMSDDDDQQETKRQYIHIEAPQRDCCAGPHYIRLQESPEGGQIHIRAAGDYINSVAGHHMTVVGGSCEEPECLGVKNRVALVSGKDITVTCEMKVDKCESSIVMADRYIMLGAGQDCPGEEESDPMGPCFAPVLVYHGGAIRVSDRVYASCSQDSQIASIFSMSPFIGGE